VNNITELIGSVRKGDFKSLSRAITIVENELEGYQEVLLSLDSTSDVPVIGVTGPPGAGKSTLINALVKHFTDNEKKVAVVAVDPTSPFNYGSLLGDRLRLSEFFNHESVFIRSVATRGSLGGLSEKIIEITDVIRNSIFDYIIVETVGVGQSEVEIAGLADTTLVVFVPESGDDIQTMKSGIMEIADIFVVNKCDREGADRFAVNLQHLMRTKKDYEWHVPVVKTSATNGEGIDELMLQLEKHIVASRVNDKKIFLLVEKAFRLLQRERMRGISREKLEIDIRINEKETGFNLYRLVRQLA
jgi:LAO/AO transport system kinase